MLTLLIPTALVEIKNLIEFMAKSYRTYLQDSFSRETALPYPLSAKSAYHIFFLFLVHFTT